MTSSLSTCQNCLICGKTAEQEELTAFTNISWTKFTQASKVSDDEVAKRYKNVLENKPMGSYHRKCYLSYTHKQHLDRLIRKRKAENEAYIDNNSSSQADSSTSAEKSKLRRSLLPTTSMEGCLICQKSKRIPKSKSLEKLSNCETFQAGATLLNAAKVRKDQRVIVAIEHQDVVAIEVKYHRSCYASYTSQKTLDAILKSDETESRKQRSEYDIAFEKLAANITENVVSKMEIVTMKVLREHYLELLEELGIENREYRSEK